MRRTVRRQNVGVALFPFLAVLICTMGSLIVLLVLLVQQARVDARSFAAQQSEPQLSAEDQQRQQQELEDAQWRRELLEQSRGEKTQELAESRAKLAHLEDHIQRLMAGARELMERAQRIDAGQQLRDGELAAAQAELQRMQAEIAKKQAELDEARRKFASQEKWFALIPYQGPHGTRRRPIYIECTAEGIILQPEGLVLVPGDFQGPLGPGNPLDAALRTVREHITQTNPNAGEPYPLLVVRPNGIHAYGAARSALKAWDDEFGYELVGDEKKLVFGSPDPALAAALETSVTIARKRQAVMASMMPRRYQDDQPLKTFDSASESSAESSRETSPTGRFVGSGAGPHGGGTSGGGNPGTAPGGSAVAGASRGYPTNEYGPYGSASGNNLAGGASGSAGANGPAGGTPGGASSGNAASGSSSGQMAGQRSGQPGGGGANQSNPAGGASGTSVQFGSQRSGQSGQSKGNSQTASGGKGGSGAGRGSNWALPGAARHATAITRPIHVAVLLDRIVLVPERGIDRPPQHMKVSRELTPQEVDAFVAAVQREMKSWGLAVQNGYWKPVLQMEVAPDSEQLFADLQAALENSGFAIERKQP